MCTRVRRDLLLVGLASRDHVRGGVSGASDADLIHGGNIGARRQKHGVARYLRGREPNRYLPVRSRWLHPGQQQGRRIPSSSSSRVRRMRRCRVTFCLASSTQQMNSLRARGVMSFHASSAPGLATSASRRSSGSSCTTPPGIRRLLTKPHWRHPGREPRQVPFQSSIGSIPCSFACRTPSLIALSCSVE